MAKKSILFLLTDNYPLTKGEFFLDDEVKIISGSFDQIIILTEQYGSTSINRFVPDNVKIYRFPPCGTLSENFKAIPLLFTGFFIQELLFVIKKFKLNHFFILLKIMFAYYMKAIKFKVILNKLRSDFNTLDFDLYYYSYWHDYRALALSLLKRNFPGNIYISRAHGWDVFSTRHNPPYLPFKKYIIESLDHTFLISMAGKSEFHRTIGNGIEKKVSVARLGTIQSHVYPREKQSDVFLFCSCSSMIPLKRIHLIIDLLSKLKLKNIRWIHFGDGPLREQLESSAQKHLPPNGFCFKGHVNNEEIMNFYSLNYVDLFLNASEAEGIPFSIIEALSAGIPVMATDVGGNSEAVNHKTGFLIDKDFNAEQVAGIIENYLLGPPDNINEYRKNAFLFWQQNYNGINNYKDFVSRIFKLRHEKA